MRLPTFSILWIDWERDCASSATGSKQKARRPDGAFHQREPFVTPGRKRTDEVTEFRPGEPNPGLFKIPADYTVRERAARVPCLALRWRGRLYAQPNSSPRRFRLAGNCGAWEWYGAAPVPETSELPVTRHRMGDLAGGPRASKQELRL
jgi:hypothetical protein